MCWIFLAVLQGGSWVSTGDEASRFARFSFRRHFFQHMGFRLVRSQEAKPCPVRLCKAEVFVVGAGVEGMLPRAQWPHVCVCMMYICSVLYEEVKLLSNVLFCTEYTASVWTSAIPTGGAYSTNACILERLCHLLSRLYSILSCFCHYCHIGGMKTLLVLPAYCRQPSHCSGSDRGWPCCHYQLSVLFWVKEVPWWDPVQAVPFQQDSAPAGLCPGCGAETGSEDEKSGGVWMWAWPGLLSPHQDLQRGAPSNETKHINWL